MSNSRFVWRDLMTTDEAASKAFYQSLFDWGTDVSDMGEFGEYVSFKAGSESLGGVVHLDLDAGMPSHWISYISCDDVDVFCAKATDMGATIGVPPMDIPGVGRFAVVADPQGVYFSPFQDTSGSEESADADGPVVWNELMTTDLEAATAFYSAMFGWTTQVVDMGTGPYTIFMDGDVMVAGAGQTNDEMPTAGWVIYFGTENADGTVASISDLGGTVLFPVMDVPSVGRMSWAIDPTGAMFAVMESA